MRRFVVALLCVLFVALALQVTGTAAGRGRRVTSRRAASTRSEPRVTTQYVDDDDEEDDEEADVDDEDEEDDEEHNDDEEDDSDDDDDDDDDEVEEFARPRRRKSARSDPDASADSDEDDEEDDVDAEEELPQVENNDPKKGITVDTREVVVVDRERGNDADVDITTKELNELFEGRRQGELYDGRTRGSVDRERLKETRKVQRDEQETLALAEEHGHVRAAKRIGNAKKTTSKNYVDDTKRNELLEEATQTKTILLQLKGAAFGARVKARVAAEVARQVGEEHVRPHMTFAKGQEDIKTLLLVDSARLLLTMESRLTNLLGRVDVAIDAITAGVSQEVSAAGSVVESAQKKVTTMADEIDAIVTRVNNDADAVLQGAYGQLGLNVLYDFVDAVLKTGFDNAVRQIMESTLAEDVKTSLVVTLTEGRFGQFIKKVLAGERPEMRPRPQPRPIMDPQPRQERPRPVAPTPVAPPPVQSGKLKIGSLKSDRGKIKSDLNMGRQNRTLPANTAEVGLTAVETLLEQFETLVTILASVELKADIGAELIAETVPDFKDPQLISQLNQQRVILEDESEKCDKVRSQLEKSIRILKSTVMAMKSEKTLDEKRILNMYTRLSTQSVELKKVIAQMRTLIDKTSDTGAELLSSTAAQTDVTSKLDAMLSTQFSSRVNTQMSSKLQGQLGLVLEGELSANIGGLLSGEMGKLIQDRLAVLREDIRRVNENVLRVEEKVENLNTVGNIDAKLDDLGDKLAARFETMIEQQLSASLEAKLEAKFKKQEEKMMQQFRAQATATAELEASIKAKLEAKFKAQAEASARAEANMSLKLEQYGKGFKDAQKLIDSMRKEVERLQQIRVTNTSVDTSGMLDMELRLQALIGQITSDYQNLTRSRNEMVVKLSEELKAEALVHIQRTEENIQRLVQESITAISETKASITVQIEALLKQMNQPGISVDVRAQLELEIRLLREEAERREREIVAERERNVQEMRRREQEFFVQLSAEGARRAEQYEVMLNRAMKETVDYTRTQTTTTTTTGGERIEVPGTGPQTIIREVATNYTKCQTKDGKHQGLCMHREECSSYKGSFSLVGLCPGGNEIRCCFPVAKFTEMYYEYGSSISIECGFRSRRNNQWVGGKCAQTRYCYDGIVLNDPSICPFNTFNRCCFWGSYRGEVVGYSSDTTDGPKAPPPSSITVNRGGSRIDLGAAPTSFPNNNVRYEEVVVPGTGPSYYYTPTGTTTTITEEERLRIERERQSSGSASGSSSSESYNFGGSAGGSSSSSSSSSASESGGWSILGI